MPITIAGSGTITGISAGGLPDGVITTDDIAASAITRAKMGYAGAILQVVSTTKTDTFSTASASMTDVTGLSVSITPVSTSSKILILLSLNLVGTNGVTNAAYQLMRGSTAICIGDAASSRPQVSGMVVYTPDSNGYATISGNFLDSPSTTSATTYKVQIVSGSGASGTAYVNRTQNDTNAANFYNSRGASTITVMEVAA